MENQNISIKEAREQKKQEKQMRRENHPQGGSRGLVIAAIVVLGLIGIVVGMVAAVKHAKNGELVDAPTNILDSIQTTDWIDGNKMASTTLVEYADFECPACGSFHPLVKQLKSEFKDDVRFVFRHYPLPQHPNAMLAAKAAEAAGAQGKFFEMHDLLFENQREWSGNRKANDIFLGYAEKLGLDLDQFKTDASSKAIEERIKAQSDQGFEYLVNATPTFFIGNAKVSPKSLEEFRTLLQNALNENS